MNDFILSVLVITYNQEKYITQTLDSILTQEHNYTYEIVIGEDCSTDSTRAIIESYAKKYPTIIKPIYNNPNLGLIKNYFNTLSHCTGKYIMECAGDDWWLPGKVAFQIDYMEKHPEVGMCYGKARIWYENKKKFLKHSFGVKKESVEDLLLGNAIPAPSVCFRNVIAQEYIKTIKPESKDWLMEDYPFWFFIAHESQIKFFDKMLCCYRNVENSISHEVNIEKKFKFEKNGIDICKFYANIYSYNYIEKKDEFLLFYIYIGILKKNYNKQNAKLLRGYFKQIENKSFKMYIYILCSFNILFWKLLNLLK